MTRPPAMEDLLADAELKVAIAHHQAGRIAEARTHYAAVLALRPDTPLALCNLAVIALDEGLTEQSETLLRHAIRLRPEDAASHYNLGTLLKERERLDEAEQILQSADRLRPGHAPTLNNLGSVLLEKRRFAEALVRFERALAADPGFAEAWHNLGLVLIELGETPRAVSAFERAETLRPGGSICQLAQARSQICDWTGSDESAVIRAVREGGEYDVPPFTILSMPASLAEQLLCARRWAERWTASPPARPAATERRRREDGKLRIGYLSGDFRDHAVAFLIAELMERHDRSRFEIHAYSLGPDDGSAMRARLIAAFDRFTDLSGVPTSEAADRIASDGIDILVDLAGYTGLGRTGIPALRPAPVQVNYLGYPGTMGAGFIDYIIADAVVAPMAEQPFYTEKIVHLPDCYQPNDTRRRIDETPLTRTGAGLPREGFVFCCFNDPRKIRPEVFDVWMGLLKAVEGSALWLLDGNEEMKGNLRREAGARGVDPSRLVFAPKIPLPAHLARHRLADLFLDTLPYNAHTTASDALWAGLPVLTCAGETFAGRVAASLLRAARLPELVTRSLEEYRDLARTLAEQPDRLASLRRRLAEQHETLPLFDITRYTRNIEAAYRRMWEIHESGEPPRPFSVTAGT